MKVLIFRTPKISDFPDFSETPGLQKLILKHFFAQQRKRNNEISFKVVRSTLLHFFGSGGPPGKNPGSNISRDIGDFRLKFEDHYISKVRQQISVISIIIQRIFWYT